jgi:predicted porin
MKATFNYEIGIGNSGTGGADGNSDSGTSALNENLRQANVGISGGFGSIRLGQMTTQADNAYGAGDVGGGNNFIGRVYGGSGIQLSNARSSRLVEYATPSFNGFTAAIQYGKGTTKTKNINLSFLKPDNTLATEAVTDGSTSNKELGLGLRYAAGPLTAMVGYAKEKAQTLKTGAKGAEPKETVLGVNYNFGPATAFFTYQDGSNKNVATLKIGETGLIGVITAAGAKYDSKAHEIGVRVPVGALALQASYYDASRTWKDAGDKATLDQDGYQLAALYSMSKRTTLYAVYGTQDWKGKKDIKNVKVDNDQFGIGVRHSF